MQIIRLLYEEAIGHLINECRKTERRLTSREQIPCESGKAMKCTRERKNVRKRKKEEEKKKEKQ